MKKHLRSYWNAKEKNPELQKFFLNEMNWEQSCRTWIEDKEQWTYNRWISWVYKDCISSICNRVTRSTKSSIIHILNQHSTFRNLDDTLIRQETWNQLIKHFSQSIILNSIKTFVSKQNRQQMNSGKFTPAGIAVPKNNSKPVTNSIDNDDAKWHLKAMMG